MRKKCIFWRTKKKFQLLSANDGRDVPFPVCRVDGKLSGCVMYEDVSDAELL